MGVGGKRHASAVLPPGKDSVPTIWEAKWAPESVWMGMENLTPTGIRFPYRPALHNGFNMGPPHLFTLNSDELGIIGDFHHFS